jgi:Protein of unknown function (DUF2854)
MLDNERIRSPLSNISPAMLELFEKIPVIGKVPFAKLLLVVGGILTALGFIAFIFQFAALNFGGFFYGIPMLLGGLAFKITELKPVPITCGPAKPPQPSAKSSRTSPATATANAPTSAPP